MRGRADGFNEGERLVEEVKTYRGTLDSIPENRRALHLAQAKIYAALLCQQMALPSLRVAVVYYEISPQEETPFFEECSAGDLRAFYEGLCEKFFVWAIRELEHRRRRDDALAELHFVHLAIRGGQRELAANVYHAVKVGRHLMAQAPTGIGKTIGTIYPALKACTAGSLDKVFFLTAKTSGQQSAIEALAAIGRSNPALDLRTIQIVARDKACEHPGKSCHGDSCPMARGFYDRLPAAREAAVAGNANLDRETLRLVARHHTVCPYYLTLELVRWSDVVVADYNYFFDTSALLHALTLANEWKVAVLVDEAHNLIERARSMYTAQLSQAALEACVHGHPVLARPLAALRRAWSMLASDSEEYTVLEALPGDIVDSVGQLTADRLKSVP